MIFIAQRKIAKKQIKKTTVKVPRTRTLTAVHDSILVDIVYPFDIVGRRWRYKVDGTKQCKIYFDAREKDKAESRVETFSVIYKRFTNKDVYFDTWQTLLYNNSCSRDRMNTSGGVTRLTYLASD